MHAGPLVRWEEVLVATRASSQQSETPSLWILTADAVCPHLLLKQAEAVLQIHRMLNACLRPETKEVKYHRMTWEGACMVCKQFFKVQLLVLVDWI